MTKHDKEHQEIKDRLANIEKLLTNHIAHQKIMIDLWIKRILPVLALFIPVLVALAEKLPDIIALFVKK